MTKNQNVCKTLGDASFCWEKQLLSKVSSDTIPREKEKGQADKGNIYLWLNGQQGVVRQVKQGEEKANLFVMNQIYTF